MLPPTYFRGCRCIGFCAGEPPPLIQVQSNVFFKMQVKDRLTINMLPPTYFRGCRCISFGAGEPVAPNLGAV